MKKLFNFEGTITGNQYFLRPFLGVLFFIPGVIAGHASNMFAPGFDDPLHPTSVYLFIVFILTAYAGVFALCLSTTNKRLNAFCKSRDEKIVGWLLVLFVPFVSLYLWFADGKYKLSEE